MTVDDAHVLTDRIEARIEALWPGSIVTVHVEPIGTEPSATPGL
jgi:divalent metal cation (Fe/Co/Zn/Cd) transporter